MNPESGVGLSIPWSVAHSNMFVCLYVWHVGMSACYVVVSRRDHRCAVRNLLRKEII